MNACGLAVLMFGFLQLAFIQPVGTEFHAVVAGKLISSPIAKREVHTTGQTDPNQTRITSPASVRAAPGGEEIFVLPAGSVVTVKGQRGAWLKISAKAGRRFVNGFVELSQTTGYPSPERGK